MSDSNLPIHKLLNLGPKSAIQLEKIGVKNINQLRAKGAIRCYYELTQQPGQKPGLNFLYALFGAIENRHWHSYRKKKGEILIHLESFIEIEEQISIAKDK